MIYDVLINGGGPVGMGLAIDLAQRGLSVAVIERHATPQPIPKGQNLTQRTAEHFRAWGCEDALRAAHPLPPGSGIGGMTTYGTLLGEYHYDWLNRAKVNDYYFTANARLPQYKTEAVLRARAANLAGIETFFGWQGDGLGQDSDGVTLDISERGGGGGQTLRGRYLVGCDGANSTIRQAARITETRSDHDRLMALLVFDSPELHALLERYPGKAFYCVLKPELDGYWNFFGRVDHGTSWFFHAPVPLGTTRDNYDFRALLHRAVGQAFDLDLTHIGLWDLRVACADSYRAGRVFVAGDAAHSHPPYGGYGINTGLEDARNLGWKLAAVLNGQGGEALLDSYDAERRPVFASTARDFIESFIEEDRDFLRRHIPEKDRAAFEAEWNSRTVANSWVAAYAPNYEGSPIVPGSDGVPGAQGDHSFAARAGHHLAPATLSNGSAVQDRLGDGFTLIAINAPPERVAAFRDAAPFPLTVIEDPGSGQADRYAAPLILVRPDHYVAWAGEDGEAAEILRQAFGVGGS